MQRSIETPYATVRHKLLISAQWVFAIAVIGFASYGVARQWTQIRSRLTLLDIRWGQIVIASLIVLGAYGVLIETWRRVLGAWDTKLPWMTAARIWFASSLGKYIPGNIWAIAALGMMAKERGASGVAAAGSSIIVNVLNLAAGLAVVLMCGSKLVPHIAVFGAATVAILGVAIAAPVVLPKLVVWFCRVTGKDVSLPRIPPSTIWLSLVGTTVAWVAYGVAFQLFSGGVVGGGKGVHTTLSYIAVYTGAYILGFITPIAPAGLGVREAGIVGGMAVFKLMGHADALIVALTSRLWLTVLEVAPGLVAPRH